MDYGKGMDAENSSELNASIENDNEIEDIGKIERQEFSAVMESELQSKHICMQINDVKDRPNYQHTGLEVENCQQIKSSVYKYEENLHFSSSKETRYKKQETVSTKNPVNTLNRIESRRVDKSERPKLMSLRREVLMWTTYLKYFSEEDGGFICCDDIPSEFKQFEVKISKIPDEDNDETRNSSLESIDENSFFTNEFQLHSASTNLAQEASTNEIQHSVSVQSNLVSTKIPAVTVTGSQTKNIWSGEDVWDHFKGFLQVNKESLDRIFSDDPGSEKMETSDHTNRSVKDAKMTVQETVNQNIEEPFDTELEDMMKYILGSVITLVLQYEPNSALVLIHEIRICLFGLIRMEKEMIKNKQDQGLQEQDKLKEINCFSAAQKMRQLLQRYFEILCDDQKLVDLLDQNKLHSRFCNLSNLTSLLELPLPATDIRSFYTLFLYLQKSLHSEVPAEDVFKRIDSENCEYAYQKYCERKALINRKREMAENNAFGRISAFKKTLDLCRLIITHKNSDFESTSLRDYKNFINNLRLDIYDRLTLLYKLISGAYSLVDPINSYLNVLRLPSLLQLDFIDTEMPDVFSWLS